MHSDESVVLPELLLNLQSLFLKKNRSLSLLLASSSDPLSQLFNVVHKSGDEANFCYVAVRSMQLIYHSVIALIING